MILTTNHIFVTVIWPIIVMLIVGLGGIWLNRRTP
jgi:hypothetical protein